MAKSAQQKVKELQSELDDAYDRIDALEEHIRAGTDLLDVEDLEEALGEAEMEEDEDPEEIDEE